MKLQFFESIKVVKGIRRAAIYNLQNAIIKFIPIDMANILAKLQGDSVQNVLDRYSEEDRKIINSYIDYIIDNNFGFLAEDDLSTLFIEMSDSFDSAPIIDNMIIEYNPKFKNHYPELIHEISKYCCQAVEVRFYHEVTLEEIRKFVSLFKNSSILVLELILPFVDSIDFEHLIVSSNRISKILAFNAPENSGKLFGIKSLTYSKEKINNSSHCGHISTSTFSINTPHYLESLNYNNCLNKKLSIDIDGYYKNCPATTAKFGNVEEDSLSDVLNHPKLKEQWGINKDQIDTCKVCEFRYVCSDCRAFTENDNLYAKPSKCSYDPYTAKWL